MFESGGVVVKQKRTKQRGAGELESAVMEVLWDSGGWLTPGEVQESLESDLAHNTVHTILARLWDKQRLDRRRDGRSHVYRPVQTREEYVAARMGLLLGEAKDRSVAMVGFLESLDESDRDQMRRMLGRTRKGG